YRIKSSSLLSKCVEELGIPISFFQPMQSGFLEPENLFLLMSFLQVFSSVIPFFPGRISFISSNVLQLFSESLNDNLIFCSELRTPYKRSHSSIFDFLFQLIKRCSVNWLRPSLGNNLRE
ncbi:Unknown protein, partial [Striga hermonthica]